MNVNRLLNVIDIKNLETTIKFRGNDIYIDKTIQILNDIIHPISIYSQISIAYNLGKFYFKDFLSHRENNWMIHIESEKDKSCGLSLKREEKIRLYQKYSLAKNQFTIKLMLFDLSDPLVILGRTLSNNLTAHTF